jgi:hypothetical protein
MKLCSAVPFGRKHKPVKELDSACDNGKIAACRLFVFIVADAARGTGGLRHTLPRTAFRVIAGASGVRGIFPTVVREVIINMNAQLPGQP